VQHTTGFTAAQITDLCELVWREQQLLLRRLWPPILGLFKAVVVTLTYLRRNRVQVDLAETFGVSQPTISRAISSLTPVLDTVLAQYVPVAEDLDQRHQYLVDGTLVPCWSWKSHPELYSGKHKTTGKNVQVACDHYGRLVWISDPVDGARHDAYAIRASGVLDTFTDHQWIGDKGYLGLGMLTPHRKPARGDLTSEEKEHNRAINQIRAVVERVIANLKTWRILHTDYRRPPSTFDQTISTVIALHFYKIACE
jgi:DDE superfamily endonuclease/Helix-turn-helix of DDE superfamily endonuclease